MKKLIAGAITGAALMLAVPASAATTARVPAYRALPGWIGYFHAQPRDERLVGLRDTHRRCIVLTTRTRTRSGEMICADGQVFRWKDKAAGPIP